MTDKDKIKIISGLLNELDPYDLMTREEFEIESMDLSLKDIIDEMWNYYCFALDIKEIINPKQN